MVSFYQPSRVSVKIADRVSGTIQIITVDSHVFLIQLGNFSLDWSRLMINDKSLILLLDN